MALKIIVTNAGRAALVNAANTGTAPVTIAQVGLSATAVAPTPTITALPGEHRRIDTLSGDVVADDIIHMIVRDEGSAVYTVRSIGLYLADGTLFAVYGQPAVIVEKSAQSMMLLAIDVQFADVDATSLTFGDANFLNPPATETMQGVAEIATQAETDAGTDDRRFITAKKLKSRLDSRNATETLRGLIEIATQAETNSGTDDARAVTPKKLKGTIDARLTAAAILALLLTVDGAGSGVDGDLLDGEQGAFYLNLANATGTLPNARLSGSYDGITEFISVRLRANASTNADLSSTAHAFQTGSPTGYIIKYSGSRIQAMNNATGTASDLLLNHVGGDVRINGSIAWHAGNDGAGSGADSDLLDGEEGAFYLNLANSTGALPNERLFGSYDSVTSISATSQLHARGAGVATLTSTNHPLQAGPTSGPNTAFSTGRIQARNNGIASPLWLNHLGGDVLINTHLAWHAGNDGAGSGSDADLLDGEQGAFYRNLANATGTLPDTSYGRVAVTDWNTVNRSGFYYSGSGGSENSPGAGAWSAEATFVDTGTGSLIARKISNAGGEVFTRRKFGGIWHPWIRIDGLLAYTAANDGAGSGMDADLLDGLQGSAYVRHDQFEGSYSGASGWMRLPNGFVLQWGRYRQMVTETSVPITFPVAFPAQLLSAQAIIYNAAGTATHDLWIQRQGEGSLTGQTFRTQGDRSDRSADGFDWWAMGL